MASGGAVLLMAGTKGKRYMLPHAKVMIHQPYGGVYGQAADIEIQAEEILKTKEKPDQHHVPLHRADDRSHQGRLGTRPVLHGPRGRGIRDL